MADDSTATAAAERDRILHAAVLASLLYPGEPNTSRGWRRLLEPSVVVAIITVIGGGLIGSYLTAKLQASAKERELAMAQFTRETDARLSAVADAYDLVGDSLAAAENLLSTTSSIVAEESPTTAMLADAERRRREACDHFNEAHLKWRIQNGRSGVMLSYHHDGSGEVIRAWRAVKDGVDAYYACSRREYAAFEAGAEIAPVRTGCEQEGLNAELAVERLGRELQRGRMRMLRRAPGDAAGVGGA